MFCLTNRDSSSETRDETPASRPASSKRRTSLLSEQIRPDRSSSARTVRLIEVRMDAIDGPGRRRRLGGKAWVWQ
jgi:hypothetical protein